MKEVTADAAPFLPDGIEQGSNRLGQFLSFPGRNFHVHDDQSHASNEARSMPSGRSRGGYAAKALISKGRGGNGNNRKKDLQGLFGLNM